MAMNDAVPRDTVRAYILDKLLPGEDPEFLEDTTPLISDGILDSISTVQLVSFLEERFGVEFEAHEINADYLGSVDQILRTVEVKQQRVAR